MTDTFIYSNLIYHIGKMVKTVFSDLLTVEAGVRCFLVQITSEMLPSAVSCRDTLAVPAAADWA